MRNLNLSLWSVTNPAVTLFAIIVALAAGAMAYVTLGRAEDPTFTIKTMVVQAVWPGATAEEMQNLVAEPIEKRIQELPELDHVRTFSRPGAVVLQVQLKDSVREEAAEVWYQIRKKVGDLRPQLPQGLIGPLFNDEYGDVFSAIYLVTGEGLGRAELKVYAERLRTRLLAVEDAAKVALIGDVEERIFVEISHRRLATLGISPQLIFDAIDQQNAMAATGAFQTAADEMQVRVSGELGSLSALRDLPIAAGDAVFRLGDIADVRRGYEDPPAYLAFLNGAESVGVGVAMAEGANVVHLGEMLETEVEAFRADLPIGVEVTQASDQADIVEHAFDEFIVTFLEALVIVLVVSFVTLGLRTGIVVALSVPIVLAVVFVIMQVMGLNFDRITLGALIIALGLLVDDAIIAVEMMIVKIEQGYDRIAAASAAWQSTAFPMLTGTLVTAAGFLPVGLAQSTSGEYAGNIFWVVGIALIVSWFVAVIVTPYLGLKLLPPPKPGAHHASYDSRPYRLLRAGVNASLRARWAVIGLTVAGLVATGVGMGLVQQQFFPTSARAELFIETRMPEGTSIEATAKAALAAEALVKGDPDVRFSSTYVGAGSPRFFFALNPALPNPSFAMTVIMARDAAARDRLRARIEAAVAAGAVPEARIRVDQIIFGPPVGFPVQFRVIGPDPLEVRRIAADVRAAMVANPNTVEPQFDWNEQAKTLQVRLDQNRIRALGLNTADVSNTLQTLLSGVKVTEYREGTELIDVIVRAPAEERANPSQLGGLTVLLPGGGAVPLSQLAEVTYGFEEPILWRRNRDMVLTVRADIVAGVQAPTVTAQIEPPLQSIIDALPPGYRIETGGAVEESSKANAALFKVFPLMFLVMLTLLMLQLRSFSKLFLVFLTAPLGAIGAVAALLIFNAPFGFVALLGVIALAGMIMRNTVILVDQIDHDLAAGSPPWEAIVESTVRRARPVVLTALAAILAMVPLARSVFWGPMALSIMGGLIVATVLTLFFLPALYAAWFRVKRGSPAKAQIPDTPLILTPDYPPLRLAGE
jgi:multidrug efflux pump subunit AcrB